MLHTSTIQAAAAPPGSSFSNSGGAQPATQSSRPRPQVVGAHRLVVKLGTRVLTENGGLAQRRLREILHTVAALRLNGREVLVVSSGAVDLGRRLLGLEEGPETHHLRQACAAVGQSHLTTFYQRELAQHGLMGGQVLLTEFDFHERSSYLQLRHSLDTLLKSGVVPILNENDVVTTSGPRSPRTVFGDNDRLAALVAAKLEADLLVLLTDVPGVLAKDPKLDPRAPILPHLDHPRELGDAAGESGSGVGRGGMRSKVAAAFVAARGGCPAVIASGLHPGILSQVVAGEELGTLFPAHRGLRARRRWIGFAAVPKGVLHLDGGAVVALLEKRASLLPVGVRASEGDYHRGDVVELRGPDGVAIGRGLVLYDAADVESWCQDAPPADLRHPNALIRRSHLVLEPT